MIVIFEGVDGSGKTTLIDEVHRRTFFPIYRVDETPMDGTRTVAESQAANRASIEMALAVNADVLLDRSFVSEWVYSTVFGREFDAWAIGYLDVRLKESEGHLAVLLWFEKPEDALRRLKPGDHISTISQAFDLQLEYSNYVDRSLMQWLVLDANDTVEHNAVLVVDRIREIKEGK